MNKPKILIPIHPQWCEKIFNGEKTIEVRKTVPKIEPPFEVFVYETLGKRISCRQCVLFPMCALRSLSGCYEGTGEVIGSFICDKITRYESEFWDDDTYERIQEPWEPSDFAEYGEYEYDTIGENGEFYGKGIELSKQSCLSWNELRKYVGQGLKDFYGWHIIEPKLYDKPRELGEFYTICNKYGDDSCGDCPYLAVEQCSFPCDDCVDTWCSVDNIKPITRPPQSWCRVEELQ